MQTNVGQMRGVTQMPKAETKDLHDGLPPMLSVTNMANGALDELLGEALKRLAENISDPNTSEKQKRSISIKFAVTPYHDRSGFTYDLTVESKLAGMRPANGTAYIARKNGEYLVVGKNHRQMEMELGVQDPEPSSGKPI